jgi:hypothetical protein
MIWLRLKALVFSRRKRLALLKDEGPVITALVLSLWPKRWIEQYMTDLEGVGSNENHLSILTVELSRPRDVVVDEYLEAVVDWIREFDRSKRMLKRREVVLTNYTVVEDRDTGKTSVRLKGYEDESVFKEEDVVRDPVGKAKLDLKALKMAFSVSERHEDEDDEDDDDQDDGDGDERDEDDGQKAVAEALIRGLVEQMDATEEGDE